MNKPYEKFFERQVLTELAVSEISQLKNYLKTSEASDYEKGKEIIYTASYVLDIFTDEMIKAAEAEDDKYFLELIEGSEWYDIADMLNSSSSYDKLKELIYTKIGHNPEGLDILSTDLPTWVYLSSPKIFKNQWLIHFTEDADGIANNGFDHLVTEIDKLGLTTYYRIDSSEVERSPEGFGFAYMLGDYKKYGRGGRGSRNGEWKYGTEAVLFRASGVRAYHGGDEEYQSIFKGDTARDIIPITQDDGYCVHNKNTGKAIFRSEELEKVVDWVIDNYVQYQSVL